MVKFSLYIKEEELALLDAARDSLINATGVKMSRNGYIRSLLFSLFNNENENGESLPTNPLQSQIVPRKR